MSDAAVPNQEVRIVDKNAEKSLGKKIEARRKAKGWIQVILAQKVGTTPRTVIRWEQDDVFPKSHHVIALKRELGLEESDFLAAMGIPINVASDDLRFDSKITPPVYRPMPGRTPLIDLANVDVSEPSPIQGANAVYGNQDRRQAIGLTVRPSFGTLRDEELIDPNGTLLAIADLEVSYANIIIFTADEDIAVLSGIGLNGEEKRGSITCQYKGTDGRQTVFEVRPVKVEHEGASPHPHRMTLAGISVGLANLAAIEGKFTQEDWVGVGLKTGGLEIVSFYYPEQSKSDEKDTYSLKDQIKRQVLKRGIQIEENESSRGEIHLASKKYFMKRIFDENQ